MTPYVNSVTWHIYEQWRAAHNRPTMPNPGERIVTPMPRKLVERIDEFRWSRRLPSRAEAIRQLIEAGLKGQTKEPKIKPP
jgi:hypothetical protein